ncbi:MAG: pyrimidine-nucleoside phosphorylase, partial [Clostridia bacterium]|nr:pyrimidine-nucleoside phosphorylase [Clostridia bacterium]
MNTERIIRKKRDGNSLSFDEIRDFIGGFVSGKIPDYQMSALLMAIYFNGMTDAELFDFTTVMANSGDVLDLTAFGNL